MTDIYGIDFVPEAVYELKNNNLNGAEIENFMIQPSETQWRFKGPQENTLRFELVGNSNRAINISNNSGLEFGRNYAAQGGRRRRSRRQRTKRRKTKRRQTKKRRSYRK